MDDKNAKSLRPVLRVQPTSVSKTFIVVKHCIDIVQVIGVVLSVGKTLVIRMWNFFFYFQDERGGIIIK